MNKPNIITKMIFLYMILQKITQILENASIKSY